jgi:hypothetical protein
MKAYRKQNGAVPCGKNETRFKETNCRVQHRADSNLPWQPPTDRIGSSWIKRIFSVMCLILLKGEETGTRSDTHRDLLDYGGEGVEEGNTVSE